MSSLDLSLTVDADTVNPLLLSVTLASSRQPVDDEEAHQSTYKCMLLSSTPISPDYVRRTLGREVIQ